MTTKPRFPRGEITLISIILIVFIGSNLYLYYYSQGRFSYAWIVLGECFVMANLIKPFLGFRQKRK